MKADIIIPVHNDGENLWKSILSIGQPFEGRILIVDDASEKPFDFSVLKASFEHIFDIELLRSERNIGPGGARNLGLEKAKGEAVIFLDCGDVFYSPFTVRKLLGTLSKDESIAFISSASLEEKDGELFEIGPKNNRCHGKAYRRSFLEKYKIRFNEDWAFANEDIGFNFLARLLSGPKETVFETNEVGVIQTEGDKSSITRRNDYEFSFKDTNLGTAKNAVHAFNRARKLGVSEGEIAKIGYNVICFMYRNYIQTLNVRPRFAPESFFGAVYFYHYYFGRLKVIDNELLLSEYNKEMAAAFEKDLWFRENFQRVGFEEFLKRLFESDKRTDWKEETFQ